jgi:hypothetical protein
VLFDVIELGSAAQGVATIPEFAGCRVSLEALGDALNPFSVT